MTETKTRTPAEIRAELDATAPLPDADAGGEAAALALHFAARAQERWARMLLGERDPNYVAAMAAEFAASHALRALYRVNSGEADLAADQIAGALEDGGSIGEWLWDHLRTTADRITALAEELDAAVGDDVPVTGLTQRDLKAVLADAHRAGPSDPSAFNRAAEAAGLLPAGAGEAVTS